MSESVRGAGVSEDVSVREGEAGTALRPPRAHTLRGVWADFQPPILLGEAPARPRETRRETAPEGPLGGRSGRFLRSLTGDLDYEAFRARWEPRNLLQEWPGRPPGGGKGSWLPPDLARQRLLAQMPDLDGRVLVTLGARVRSLVWAVLAPQAAKGRQPAWFQWVIPFEPGEGPVAWAAIPHPSGLTRLWNSPEMRAEGARCLNWAQAWARGAARIPRDGHP